MSTIELGLPYQSPLQREQDGTLKPTLKLSPFNVQRIVYELVTQHWFNNDPSLNGFNFDQKYNPADSDSSIIIDMGYQLKFNPLSKRPAIFVTRSDANYSSPVMNQTIGVDPKNSQETKLHTISMGLTISCIASPVALAEQMAEWTSDPLLQYESQIRCDFRFRRFRMATITRPQVYAESKDNFIILIQLETVFDSNVLITADHLKLKTISRSIFLGLDHNKPLTNQ